MHLLHTTIPVSNLVTLKKIKRVTVRRKTRERKMATMRKMKMYGHRGRDHVAAQERERTTMRKMKMYGHRGRDHVAAQEEEGEGGAVEEREGTCQYMYIHEKYTHQFVVDICNHTCIGHKSVPIHIIIYKQYCACM